MKGCDEMFIDTHCHIFSEYYEDMDAVFKRAKDRGIPNVINNATNPSNVKELLKLKEKYPQMYLALGYHPEDVDQISAEDLEDLEGLLSTGHAVAIGEIGLDYHYTKENKTEQEDLFRAQLALAEKYHLPVIIHSRDATEDTIRILKDYSVKGVIHSFSGSYETAQIYIKMGYALGVNGVVTFKNSHLKEIIKRLPLESIVLETDSPYLTPEPHRGMRNEPGYVADIASFVADIYGISVEKLSEVIGENVRRIFDIS